MGADQVGIIAVGPREIGATDLRRGATSLWAWLQEDGRAQKKICSDCGEICEEAEIDDCPCCGHGLAEGTAQDIYGRTAEACLEYLKTTFKEWPPDFRDVASRSSPENDEEIIVFAGEMSWGDEPSGRGYQVLKRIYSLPSEVRETIGFL